MSLLTDSIYIATLHAALAVSTALLCRRAGSPPPASRAAGVLVGLAPVASGPLALAAVALELYGLQ